MSHFGLLCYSWPVERKEEREERISADACQDLLTKPAAGISGPSSCRRSVRYPHPLALVNISSEPRLLEQDEDKEMLIYAMVFLKFLRVKVSECMHAITPD